VKEPLPNALSPTLVKHRKSLLRLLLRPPGGM